MVFFAIIDQIYLSANRIFSFGWINSDDKLEITFSTLPLSSEVVDRRSCAILIYKFSYTVLAVFDKLQMIIRETRSAVLTTINLAEFNMTFNAVIVDQLIFILAD